MRLDIDNIGQYGVITDKDDYSLPLGAWSDSRNVAFRNGVAIKLKGHSDAFSATTSISISPIFAISVATDTDTLWAYANRNSVYGTDGATHTEISDASYTGTATLNWTGGNFGGIVILNNGINCPRQWGDSGAAPSLAKQLKILENWSSTASTTCQWIRPFKNYLIAGDITDGGNRNPRLIHWSHVATFGTVPSSWNYGDPTVDAGRYEFQETDDFLIDGLQLADSFVVYKQYSTWGMQYIGPPSVFRIYRIFPDNGILTRRCAALFNGNYHAVFGHNNIYAHNGQTLNQIFNGRINDWIYNQLDSDNYVRSYVVADYTNSEILFCFPSSGATDPNLAAVWNYQYNTTAIRSLDGFSHMAYGPIPTLITTWDADTGTWDSDSDPWDLVTFNPSRRSLLACKPSTKKLYVLNTTEQADGSNIESYITRLGVPMGRILPTGEVKQDVTIYKNVYTIYPRITGTAGGILQISIGRQLIHGGPVTWDYTANFTIGTDYKIDVRTAGKVIGIRILSNTNITWKLDGLSIDWEAQSDR